jgi:hypothetical protein
MVPLWVRDRIWCETLLIPREGKAQELFRTLFTSRREQDLIADGDAPARLALDWAARQVRSSFPAFRPLVPRSLLQR